MTIPNYSDADITRLSKLADLTFEETEAALLTGQREAKATMKLHPYGKPKAKAKRPASDDDTVVAELFSEIHATPFTPIDPTKIPPRQWLGFDHYIRKYIVADVAPGGGGKTSNTLVEAISMALGCNYLDDCKPIPRSRVWYWNGEDPKEEIDRRIAAICKYYKINQEELVGWLWLDSGRNVPIRMGREDRETGIVIAEPIRDALIAEIIKLRIDQLMIDPFVSSHAVSENDNAKIDRIVKEGWALCSPSAATVVSVSRITLARARAPARPIAVVPVRSLMLLATFVCWLRCPTPTPKSTRSMIRGVTSASIPTSPI